LKITDFLTFYLCIINIFAFFLMMYDKYKARTGGWRISESQLIVTAIFGGALGMIVSMKTFRHKTMHIKFSVGLPIIFVLNIVIFSIAYGSFSF
jgi:uncharacterized membrane protein YsdA (DUF1294 family)